MPLIETRRTFTGELDGHPLQIDYQTFRRVPPPSGQIDNDLMRANILTVTHDDKTDTFEGDQIESIDSPLGRLVTVRLFVVPDLGTHLLSVVVPPMGALPADGKAKLHSLAVRTVEKTTFAGPAGVQGQLTSYTIAKLHGEMYEPQ
jgi:hypothetical protein